MRKKVRQISGGGGGGVEYRYLGGLRMFRDISLFAFNQDFERRAFDSIDV